MPTLQQLEKQLQKVEAQLAKYRQDVAVLAHTSRTSQRRWKSERNWDYWANEKFRLIKLIEEHNK